VKFCVGGKVLPKIALVSGPRCFVLRYIGRDVSEGLLALFLEISLRQVEGDGKDKDWDY